MLKERSAKRIWITGVIILACLAALSAWLFFGKTTAKKLSMFSALRIPIAFVGGVPVYATELKAIQTLNYTSSDSYQALLRYKKLEALNGFYSAQNSILIADEAPIFLKFQNAKNNLAYYYNSQKNLNENTYALAHEILDKLNSGVSFDSLSYIYNQDDFSKMFGGQTGEINKSEILPEILSQLDDTKISQPQIIASRLGLHVIEVSYKNADFLKIKQIFLKTQNFDEWLNNQEKNIKTLQLLKLNYEQ